MINYGSFYFELTQNNVILLEAPYIQYGEIGRIERIVVKISNNRLFLKRRRIKVEPIIFCERVKLSVCQALFSYLFYFI